jgi:VIT1/CCC1 family predicted Fe2+/Mn2+ transporter
MRAFIQRYLDPAGRLGEMLFALIMALGFTGAVRLGHEQADNHALLVGILGCNLAWAIVDGVMYVLNALFERGRKNRLIRQIAASSDDDAALRSVADELDDRLEPLTTPEERDRFYRGVLRMVREGKLEPTGIQREDLLGGVAVALLIAIVTLPIIVPFIVLANPSLAARISNLIALAMLFLLGAWWGRIVGGRWFRIATGLTLLGVVLVGITISLGG